MSIFGQHACLDCYFVAVLRIQSEKEWIENLIDRQAENLSKTTESHWNNIRHRSNPSGKSLSIFRYRNHAVTQNVVIRFENTWQTERHYGGKRKHEGIDLMAEPDKSGYFPVLSMTDGTIEQVGWLEKGGWRIGIRSISGNYYYYAHFHSYIKDWKRGDPVKAGDLLGYMGDSGYGPEGTTGQFPVHLHLGIYLPAAEKGEQAINPYWMLRYLESKRLSYIY